MEANLDDGDDDEDGLKGVRPGWGIFVNGEY